MEQTFTSYLKKRLKEQSGLDTTSIRRLFPVALGNDELAPILFLYAASQKKVYHLMSIAWDTHLEKEYRAASRVLKECETVEAFETSPRTPMSYRKIYEDFLRAPAEKKAKETAELHEMERLRVRTVRALEKCEATRYSVCKALKLNPGNVYAYLSGNLNKVSIGTARQICDYVYSLF